MVACGAAGGIAATFNAPIAGVLFALEVILGRVVTRRFGYVVISAVVADFLAQGFLGNTRAFILPEFGIVSGWEFGFYVILASRPAWCPSSIPAPYTGARDRFDSLKKIPEPLKPVIGGLAVGAIGLYSLNLLGVGYEGITQALSGELALDALAIFLVLKIVGTSLTLGSGGSGGVFAPSLFIGAMLGTAAGQIFGNFFPALTAPAGAYGIVGMAAVFAGSARAPFSAILIIFELTGNYAIILPLMTAVVITRWSAGDQAREHLYAEAAAPRRGPGAGRTGRYAADDHCERSDDARLSHTDGRHDDRQNYQAVPADGPPRFPRA